MLKSIVACSILLSQPGDAFHFPSTQLGTSHNNANLLPWKSSKRFATLEKSTVDFDTTSDEREEKKDFDWFNAWHPLVPTEFLDLEKPHAMKLLGMDIVIWNDGPVDKSPLFGPRKNREKGAKKSEGQWRVFVDQCPHRMVPLSEGRIEDDGSLFCSYHGWRFDGEGALVDIPQISGTTELEKIRSNPKSNCNSFPVQMVDGVLWVWPDSSDDARIQSALTEVPSLNLKNDVKEDRVWKGTWNFRELPYGHDYFIENVVDPAHVPISHHNIVGNRYDEQTLSIKTLQSLTKDGFSIMNSDGGGTNFKAPSQVLIKSPYGEQGACQYLELYSSPSRPGFTNHVGRMLIVKPADGTMPKMLRQYTLPIPKWLNHLVSSSFLNQDALFLHFQERALAHNKQYRASMPGVSDNYESAVLPISADKGVLHFRKWMKKFAGGYIPFKGDITMPTASNEVVFDVWNSHTKHCKTCLTALKNLKKIRFASFFASTMIAIIRPRKLGLIGTTVSSLLLAALGAGMNKLIGLFYRFEFSHSDNH